MPLNAHGLLDQMFRAGQQMLSQRQQTPAGARGSRGRGSSLGGLGRGALASGALAMLLGNKRRRGLGGGLMRRGGVAVLGMLAYRAFKDWQAQQGRSADSSEPRTLDRVSGDEADRHSLAILRAVIAAAKADGHIDERERQLIEAEAGKEDEESELQQWLDQELRRPVDPAEISAAAESPEIAAEMYLASRLVVDAESYMEQAYLDELARALRLDPDLRSRLDREAEQAAASRH